MDEATLLRKSELFQALDDDAMTAIVAEVRVRELQRNDRVFDEDDEAASLYVVRSGRIAITKRAIEEKESIVALMEAGDLFGEMSLFDGLARSATAWALEPSEVLFVPFGPIKQVLEGRPTLLWHIVDLLSRRLRTTDAALADSMFLDVTGRTAKRLLELAGGLDEFTLPITQEELAGMVGASRERVNKALSQFLRLGWLSVSDRRYTILQRTEPNAAPGDGVVIVWSVVVAGGSGERFGGPKQWMPLRGRRVVDWSVDAAATVAEGVVLVVPAADLARSDLPAVAAVVVGGSTRSASVRAGLAAVPDRAEVIVVHDAARPLAGTALFAAAVDAVAAGAPGAVAAVPVADTLKRVVGADVVETVDREGLWSVQTPQAFRADVLRAADADEPDATDDAGLLERRGHRVVVVPGDRRNFKVTDPVDLAVAEALLA